MMGLLRCLLNVFILVIFGQGVALVEFMAS